MKHLLFSALSASVLFINTASAQIPGVSKVTKALPKVDLGLKVGANFQQMTGAGWKETYKPGIVGGAFIGVYKNKIGVQAEGLIRSAKFDVSTTTTTKTFVKALGLDIPAMFEYKLVPRIWVQAGPQFSMLLSAKDQSDKDVKSAFASSEISGVLGLQVKLPVHLVAGARYIMGFTDINNSAAPASAWKSRSIQAYVGFRFL